jgi:ribosome recycling factor
MLANLQQDLHKAINHLQTELSKLQAWRANPAIVEWVFVLAYGSSQPLRNVAAVTILDAQTISIQPWDKSVIKDIEKGITDANLGLNPNNNGESIMIKIPPLTEERRRELVKIASRLTEEGKVWIRTVRQEYKKKIDSAKANKEISEDEAKGYEVEVQKKIDSAIKEVEDMLKNKEGDIMKV